MILLFWQVQQARVILGWFHQTLNPAVAEKKLLNGVTQDLLYEKDNDDKTVCEYKRP